MTGKKTTNRRITDGKKPKNQIQPITHVAVLLDTSGSMGSVREATVKSYNQQIETYRKYAVEQKIYATLVKFSGFVSTLFFQSDAQSLKNLELAEYNPDGSTAMYDAIGETLDRLVYETKDGPNVSYLVTIISDGEENGSQKYFGEHGRQAVHEKIKRLEAKGNWTFTFIGANQDIREATTKLGIQPQNALRFDATPKGMNNMTHVHGNGLDTFFGARSAGVMCSSSFYAGNEDSADKIPQDVKDSIDSAGVFKNAINTNFTKTN